MLRISVELREATAAQPLDETRRSKDEFREWPGTGRWGACGCVPWVCALGINIPLLLIVGNMGLRAATAETNGTADGGVTIGVAGTEVGIDADTWWEALSTVLTDDNDDSVDDDEDDKEDDTDGGGVVFSVILPLADAVDAEFGSAGTRMIEPGRATTWTVVGMSPGGADECTTPGSCTGIPGQKLMVYKLHLLR